VFGKALGWISDFVTVLLARRTDDVRFGEASRARLELLACCDDGLPTNL
jgi:hypothetical protein